MRFLIAPDSFKESLSAQRVAEAIKKGFEKQFPDALFDLLPVGDGGEGTADILATGLGLTDATAEVSAYHGGTAKVAYAADEQTALVEMAEVAGLENIPPEDRDPLKLSTKGLGELIRQLVNQGVKKIIIGVGGSATNDGGIGMAAGLGYDFFDAAGRLLEPVGANLGKVASFTADRVPENLKDAELIVVSDVTNKLCGPLGATYVFGPQKGLPEERLREVDDAMYSFYTLVSPETIHEPGSGAGGGMAAGLRAFASGTIVSGIDYVLDSLDFDRRAARADVIIVGEGKMDGQSFKGKAPVGIAERVPEGKLVIAICGSLGDGLDDLSNYGIHAVFPTLSRIAPWEDIRADTEKNVRRTSENIAALIKAAGLLAAKGVLTDV